jgi:hypothetical protein
MADGFASVSPWRPIPSADPRGNFTELLCVEAPGKNLQHLARKNTRQFELIETKKLGIYCPVTGREWLEKFKVVPISIRPEFKK